MQTIYIDVKDSYVSNVLKMLSGVKDIMIDKIKLESKNIYSEDEDTFMALQSSSLQKTWSNDEDEAWDEL
ncbi:MAG TPA: hypothetical protein EYG98_00660 [Sulfurovum sp.]|nr:hypothetical protein [Sulfurovum sp.]